MSERGDSTMKPAHDAAFLAFVERQRPTLLSCAYLCCGQVVAAQDLVESALARVYLEWEGPKAPHLEALRLVAQPNAAQANLPWRSHQRFQLVDASHHEHQRLPVIVRKLSELPFDARRVLVVSLVAGLTLAETAVVVGANEREVRRLIDLARQRLVAETAAYGSRATLTHALRSAVPSPPHEGEAEPEIDLANGRFLVNARRRRGLLGVAAGITALVLLATPTFGFFDAQFFDAQGEVAQQPAPAMTPVSAGPLTGQPAQAAPCDTTEVSCRYRIAKSWRKAMIDVTREYLDPDEAYFSGVSYSYDEKYEDPGLWNGSGGALGVDIFRLHSGATQIYLQIATSRKFAARCGAQTDHRCVSQRFLDGNRFTLTESSRASEGVEVQFAPEGSQVITVAAWNRGSGEQLPINRGQLMNLLLDPRLRLPQI